MMGVAMYIKDEQWAEYEETGFLRLGRVLDDEHLSNLQTRIDDIMLGHVDMDYDQLLMQLDSTTGQYEDAGEQSNGWKGSTLAYRKIQNLEIDPEFLEYLELPMFLDICDRTYGYNTPISCFRAMFMNKPARQGTVLPWHQDAWNYLDKQPLVTIWTALDPATVANGCVEVLPGTHRLGLINPAHTSGFLSQEQAEDLVAKYEKLAIELEPGEAVLLHNWLVHSSDINRTDIPRRAFSVCYMEGDTKSDHEGETFTHLFAKAFR